MNVILEFLQTTKIVFKQVWDVFICGLLSCKLPLIVGHKFWMCFKKLLLVSV